MWPKSRLARKLRGAGNRGEAESTRVQLLKECVERASIANSVDQQPKSQVCPCISQPVIQQPTTPNQLSFILDQAVSCPILYVTPVTTYGCQPTYTEPIPPLTGPDVEPPQGPAVADVYRKFSRIGGIDQISKPFVSRASSDRTAKLRASIVSQSQTRYVQTVIPLVPYPPCLPPRVGPAAGVPIAPNNVCNPGTRRVDFSNPKA